MKIPGKTTIAIIAILILAITAIIKEINGAILGTALSLIAGLGGYALGTQQKPK